MRGDNYAPRRTVHNRLLLHLVLAAAIYVQVLGRTVGTDGGRLGPGVDPEALASLSLRLAELFMKVDGKAASARVPAASFDLDTSNFARWSRPAPSDK